MTAPGADPRYRDSVATAFAKAGIAPTVIADSPGFILQPMRAMIANLGCEMAQIGLASLADIATAMKLGLHYPLGPLEIAEEMCVAARKSAVKGQRVSARVTPGGRTIN